MSGAWIKKRILPGDGRDRDRWYVYYRLGGMHHKQRYAGSFHTKKDAEARRDIIRGRLAVGETTEIVDWLESLKHPVVPEAKPGLLAAYDAFTAARRDVAPSTTEAYEDSRDKIVPILGADVDPASLTVEDIQRVINELALTMKVNSVKQYVGTLRQVLDYVDVVPNPLKSPKVKYPREEIEEVNPPSTAEWLAASAELRGGYRLFARLLECCGLRIGEALALRWGDIDWVNGRLRISRARTKTRSGQRWLPVPGPLLDELAGLVPEEDRILAARVFGKVGETGFRKGLTRAIKAAGVPYFHPHALRHRRISLWYAHGISDVQIAAWSGHAQASMSKDVYGHVLIDATRDEWKPFWLAAYHGGAVAYVGHEGVVE